MLLIETFMLDPAKLATNCVSANGNMSLRLAEALRRAVRCDIPASIAEPADVRGPQSGWARYRSSPEAVLAFFLAMTISGLS